MSLFKQGDSATLHGTLFAMAAVASKSTTTIWRRWTRR
jgi:hypothetical protein